VMELGSSRNGDRRARRPLSPVLSEIDGIDRLLSVVRVRIVETAAGIPCGALVPMCG